MLVLAAAGGAPFVAGALVSAGAAAGSTGIPLSCPFRAATGLPCPLCGGTRAFAAVAQGSPDVLRFNAALVLIAGLVVVVALAGLLAPRFGRRVAALSRREIVPAVLAGVVFAWTWALLHRDAILD
jgi:hypothetical protein